MACAPVHTHSSFMLRRFISVKGASLYTQTAVSITLLNSEPLVGKEAQWKNGNPKGQQHNTPMGTFYFNIRFTFWIVSILCRYYFSLKISRLHGWAMPFLISTLSFLVHADGGMALLSSKACEST